MANANSTGYDPLRGTGPGTNPVNPTPYYDPSTGTNPQKTGVTYDPLQGKNVPVALSPNSTTPAAAADTGGGGGGGGGDNGPSPYESFLMEQARIAEQRRQQNAIESIRGVMTSYGLGSLMDKITQWVRDGYEADAIQALIRTTPEYKDRFPAMDALAKKGRAISEADYINYEKNASSLEHLYGMPTGTLSAKDSITKYLTGEVSAKELEDRTIMASAAQYELPPEFRKYMRDYYNIDSGGLTAFFVEPENALPLLTKDYVSAQIGMEAGLRDLNVNVDTSEMLYQRGVDRDAAAQGFTQVAGQRSFEAGKGETATQGQLIEGNFGLNADSGEKVKRIGQSRAGAFAGGGAYAGDKSGATGVGSASS